jgi:hypothetical protein
MASPVNAVFCALVATAVWAFLGYAVSRHLLPRALAIGAAPILGWAIVSAATLPIFVLIGFSATAVTSVAALCALAGAISLVARETEGAADGAPLISWWCYAVAAVLAVVPAIAIVPKISAGAVHLADPIFDHSKIAIIDAMTRQGLPPVNPVFGEIGSHLPFAYYYLWHFSAAEVALPLHVSGWEADIGLTWFTAFGSLTLMMGLAVWLSGRSTAALWVVVVAAAASLRTTLGLVLGAHGLGLLLAPSTGFAGWLFQAAWVPQHVMSASCVVTAMLLIAHYAQRQSRALLPAVVLVVVAGFESSTYVGGVTLALAVLAGAPVLFLGIDRGKRLQVLAGLAVAAVVVACCVAPFIDDQLANVAARGDYSPIVVRPFAVLGEMFPPPLRRILDVPAYWLILLPIEFPVPAIAGVIALVALLRSTAPGSRKSVMALLACIAGAGLFGSWLLVSTLGDNNDLGLRAVLPAAMVLIVAAAAGMALVPRRALIVATALGGIILSVPDTVAMIRSNIVGTPTPDGAAFAQTPELWQAVRRYAQPSQRVANNPLFLKDLTPWPANMSWALLADRGSCFAGREMALAFAPLSPPRRQAIDAQFIRVFAGQGTPDDIGDMANKYGCDVVVVVPEDKAWNNDPFASSPHYRLVENRPDRWRIYVLRQ